MRSYQWAMCKRGIQEDQPSPSHIIQGTCIWPCCHTAYPFLGASPDGLVCCSCCGKGLLEIKCPYSIRDRDPGMVTGGDFLPQHHRGMLAAFKKAQLLLSNPRPACSVQSLLLWLCLLDSTWITHLMSCKRCDNLARNAAQTTSFLCGSLAPKGLSPQLDNLSNKEKILSIQARGSVYCFCCKWEKGRMIYSLW